MKLPALVMSLACAATAVATLSCSSESPPIDIPANLPRYAFKPEVEDYYPSASRTLKEQGTTKIKLCYGDPGRPDQVTVDESSGVARLDEAALRWGKAVKITPGLHGGQPQPACVKVPVMFSLKKASKQPDPYEYMLPPVETPPIIIDVPPPPPRPPVGPIPLAPSFPVKPIPLSSKTD